VKNWLGKPEEEEGQEAGEDWVDVGGWMPIDGHGREAGDSREAAEVGL